MSTHNLQLSDELASFVAARVSSGQYPDASAVVNAALHLLEREQSEYDDKMAALKAAIQEGLDSGVAEGDVFAQLSDDVDQLAVLRTAIQKGIDSGIAKPGVFERVRQKYSLPQRETCA
jgi:antitoxin ParD1/3/4